MKYEYIKMEKNNKQAITVNMLDFEQEFLEYESWFVCELSTTNLLILIQSKTAGNIIVWRDCNFHYLEQAELPCLFKKIDI